MKKFFTLVFALILTATVVQQAKAQCNATFSFYSINNPDSVHFYSTGTTGANGYFWTFGDGTNGSGSNLWHGFTGSGTYIVCLTVNDSGTYCSFCDSIIITGSLPCDASFAHYSINNPDSVHFYPTGTAGTSYSWNFGDGSGSNEHYPWHFYANPGAYYACLTVTIDSVTSCTHCDTVVVSVSSPCDASFVHYNIGNPDSVHFYPNITTGTSYYYDFGDGTSSTLLNPWHFYANSGTYYACLTITMSSGVSCTWCDSVVVNGAPPCNAQFGHYSMSNPDSVHFYATTSGATGYSWNFGDGSNGTGQYPWHLYANPGIYYVCLTADFGGTYCTWCDSVIVAGAPGCGTHFAHYSISNPDSIHFYPTGTTASTYTWDFGDGTSSTEEYPWHYYANAGTYYVCLTVYGGGMTCTWCDSVTVAGGTPPPPCDAQFSFYYINNPDSLHFYATGTGNNSYYWSFGDGTYSTSQYPWHWFTTPGTYYVCLTVNNSGTYCTWCDSVTIACQNPFMGVVHNPGSDFNFDNSTGVSIIAAETGTTRIFPNPVNESAIVLLQNLVTPVDLKVYDVNGRLVYSRNKLADGSYKLNTSELSPGLYLYNVSDNRQIISRGRLVVIH